MAIFRECKHSFHIVQALFGKSASTLVFSTAKVRTSPESLRTMFASATLRLSESGTMLASVQPSVSRVAATAAKVIHSAGESGTNHELHGFHELATPLMA